jgi:paraquat-inducible protein A
MAATQLETCPDCDLLQRVPSAPGRHDVRCARCGARLHVAPRSDLGRDAAWAVTTLVLLVIANAFPILVLELNGVREAATVVDGVIAFWLEGRYELAVVVLAVAVVAPAMHAASVLGRSWLIARGARRATARNWTLWSVRLAPWGMTEVYLLGALVAFVKLDDLADVVVGPALYAFAAMSLLTAWSSTHAAGVWARLRELA